MHSYTSVRKLDIVGAATLGKEEGSRDLRLPSLCPVHVYADAPSTLKRSGTAAFDKSSLRGEAPSGGPAVHAYSGQGSSLTRVSATFGKDPAIRGESHSHGPSVHAYAEPTTTLRTSGAAAFGKDAAPRAAALTHSPPIHAYAAPASSLRKAGGVAFGSTASRPTSIHSLSRTGLLSATLTPCNTPARPLVPLAAARKPLPKLVPVLERATSPTAVDDPLACEPEVA